LCRRSAADDLSSGAGTLPSVCRNELGDIRFIDRHRSLVSTPRRFSQANMGGQAI
jgi:hypothetical protein